MLHVRPAVAACGGDEEAVGGRDEGHEIGVEPVVGGFAQLKTPAVVADAVAGLRGLYRGREREARERPAHGRGRVAATAR